MRVIRSVIVFAGLTLASLTMAAQQAVQPGTLQNVPGFDQEAVDRGRELLVAQCGFCHGSNARGGQSGPDLTRSALVQDDESGTAAGRVPASRPARPGDAEVRPALTRRCPISPVFCTRRSTWLPTAACTRSSTS